MVPLLAMHAISKTFPGVKALNRVDLEVYAGEVHAVAGENGAGKSTLMKIMTGVFAGDPGGQILIDGVATEIRDPMHARALGISIIYQELSMVENLTVAENIFLAREPTDRFGLIDRRRMNSEAAKITNRLAINVSPDALVRELSVAQKQLIEIANALSYQSRLIIMDEPTASLSNHETETLIALIKQLRASGIAIIYISHRLEEIFEIADTVTILRDGQTVGTQPIAEVSRASLVKQMVDRDVAQFYATHASHATDEIVMAVSGLTQVQSGPHQATVEDVTFNLHKGEVLGLFGLVGSGRTEIAEMIFGVRPKKGRVAIDGREADIRGPSDAIDHGIGFVTEDRKNQGLILNMSVRENFSLTHLADYCTLDFVNKKREAERTSEFAKRLSIKTPSIEQKAVNLSGGNQQKIVIAKWVARNPKILIVDEPTRGIDIGAKAEVHSLLADLAAQGVGIMVISSELPEILAISDRILVIKDGRVSAEFSKAEATQERVLEWATD